MNSLTEKIGEWIKQILIETILANFGKMFDFINQNVAEAASLVGQTPQGWNPGIFAMVRNLSETVIIPIAGMILTFVLCYELISMIIERNNLHDFDTFTLFKWIFKTYIATYILTHTFDIVMGIFSLAQHVVNNSAGVISGSLGMDTDILLSGAQAQLEAMGMGELIGLWLESSIINLTINAVSICIIIVVWGRMLEIYLTVSVAPIPFSTMVNREWGQIGNNYIKTLFALGFQGFLIMICIAVYAVLLQRIVIADNIHIAIWSCVIYTILLCYSLLRTNSLARGLFSAH